MENQTYNPPNVDNMSSQKSVNGQETMLDHLLNINASQEVDLRKINEMLKEVMNRLSGPRVDDTLDKEPVEQPAGKLHQMQQMLQSKRRLITQIQDKIAALRELL